MTYILMLVGAILVLYGADGIRNQRISWPTDATKLDKLTGRAGFFDSQVNNEFEGPLAVVMGAVICGAGAFLFLYAFFS